MSRQFLAGPVTPGMFLLPCAACDTGGPTVRTGLTRPVDRRYGKYVSVTTPPHPSRGVSGTPQIT